MKNLVNLWNKGFFESEKKDPQKVVDFCDNRGYYNKRYKDWLGNQGSIRCSCCSYNDGENENYETRKSWKIYRKYQWRQNLKSD